ncbi:MAG: helix-turn-helix domain-containing protein [Candidatus Bathyarchaeia archaeon]
MLILPCEVAVKSVVPAVKALMAQQLVEEYGMNQEQVAEILGISQSAVSKYFRKVRGHVIEVDKVQEARPLIASMVIMVVNGEHQRAEFLQLFCEACGTIRKTGMVCRFCKKSDPKIKIEECGFCMELRLGKKRR